MLLLFPLRQAISRAGAVGQINGTTYEGHNINRVGVGSGVYSLGAPRQIEFGLRISFWRRTKRAEISQ